MLARLQELDGIEHAETDFSGDHLRLALTDRTAVARATDLLIALGYVAEPAGDLTVGQWYDRDSVGDLSRVEAGMIADRVVPAVRLRHRLDDDLARALRSALVDTLHRCFVENSISSQPSPSLRAGCIEAALAAATPIVGAPIAEAVARLVGVDMAQDHRAR